MDDTTTPCQACGKREPDNMSGDLCEWINCDKCKHWFHFECVGVSGSVAEEDWTCAGCMQVDTQEQIHEVPFQGIAESTPQHLTTAVSARAIKKNQKSTTSAATSQQSTLGATSAATSQQSTLGATSAATSQQSTLGATSAATSQQSTLGATSAATSQQSTLGAISEAWWRSNSRKTNVATSNHLESAAVNVAIAPEQVVGAVNNLLPHSAEETYNSGNTRLLLSMLEEERKAKEDYIRKKYAILSQTNGESLNMSFSVELTSSQIAARQAIPTDLPIFGGEPEDWPAFISSYQNSTTVAGFSNTENMLRLQKCLKGKAKELVKDKLLIPDLVPEVITTLKLFFGRPEHIIERMIDRVRKTPSFKDKLEGLIEFALSVRNICATMEACQLQAHLSNPMLIKELVEKLPNHQKLSWAMHIRASPAPTLRDFSDWIYSHAEVAATVVSPASIKMHAVNTHTNNTDAAADKQKCVACEKGSHKLSDCEKFKKLSTRDRLKIVESNKICRRCLKFHRKRCFRKDDCGINGCKDKHNPLLHVGEAETRSSENSHGIVSAHQIQNETNQQYFRIVPVKLHGKHRNIETFAFLDEGSSVTLIDAKVFDALGSDGISKPLCLQWTGDTTRMEEESICASIQISNPSASSHKYWLNNVQTVANLALPWQSVDAEYLKAKFSHLSDIPIKSYENAEPGILIGNDNWKVAVPTKVREGNWSEPIASKCRLGWGIQGGSSASKQHLNSHRRCDCEALHEAVKNSFNLEEVPSDVQPAPENNKAIQILKETCIKKEGKYEVGLLWREKNPILPDSYQMAINRVKCLDQKLKKDPALKQLIQAQINNLLEKGYARQLSEQEITNCKERIWYLPTFIVKNPNKPNKIRLVWDAAAKTKGASLNDFLLSGPDLLNSLVDVLIAFRVGKIAVCGDICEMFHRINIQDEDMHVQRFLWRKDGDINNKPGVFVMKAMTFGIRCAPCIAHFVRNKNAEDFQQIYPRAVEAIHQAHYVDDFIDSMCTENEAIEVSCQVRNIHAAGNFHIRNWVSNSTEVVQQLVGEVATNQNQIEIGKTEKVLGMFWDPKLDVFCFVFRFARMKQDIINEPTIPTKRQLLQVLMCMFDPLGFLSSHTIGLKILLQKVWRSGIAWDTKLPEELHKFWEQSKNTIKSIGNLEIPRSYSPNLLEADDIQLHTFVDASEEAYAAVCYLRITSNRTITTSLILAKSKVSPLKPLSIPRLELQAAVMGTRLAQRIKKTRRLRVDSSHYWSDSKTVLRWLRMEPRSFQQFVMFRVGEILETTEVNQWHWVPSKLNAADQATKVKPLNTDIWLFGPKFLVERREEWPSSDDLDQPDATELRKHVLLIAQQETRKPLLKFENFSSWKELYRSVAALKFLMRRRSCAQQNLPLTERPTGCMQRSKTLLFKEAQRQEFAQEIIALVNGSSVSKQSSLVRFNLCLDDDGVLKAQGRVSSLNINAGVIVLPKDHHITFLIVREYHETAHHTAHETTINLIRGEFYIPKLRVLYRKVRRCCQWCKNNSAKPDPPQMAPIPPSRLASFQRAFSYVGVDFFGPLLVNIGRRKEKRWGVLFTCLTLRAVHLEVAHNLDTSSCVMCIKNFISRRGFPIEIYSDNGTNFKATEKVIKEELINVNYTEIEMKYDTITWRFNPPGAPHMGGVWERLVRSVKSVLKVIYPSSNFNDESLRSALCEIEFIINARPLTFVSLELEDDEALTPNHILLGSASGYKPFGNDNGDLRLRWKQTQMFADHFWHRWVKEYLPIIARRGKWFTKRPPIHVGDVVIVVDENLPRNCWPKGRITETVNAKDGQVRRATIKTQHGLLVRPATKIAVLDVGIDGSKLDH